MNEKVDVLTRITPKPRFLDGLAKRVFLNRLSEIRHGEVTVIDSGNEYRFGEVTEKCELSVTLDVNDPRFYSDLAFGGSIGAGEAYMYGYWSCSDLTKLVQIMVVNIEVVDQMEKGFASLTRPIQKFLHWLNRNTQQGSKKNISAHYDLGNDFFKLMLDDTMMYSCAIFDSPDMNLYQAQVNRLDIICNKLDLQPGDHLLEIGTGWGALALHAASKFGCKVTTTTISREQYDLAVERVKQAGLEDQVNVIMQDYRELQGKYDKLVSIEMIEAIGHEHIDTFFKKCNQLLKDDGIMLIQAITIADQRYEMAKQSVDFIQRYIFPGGFLPSVSVMSSSLTSVTDMRVFHLEDIGPHYAKTLNIWRENIKSNLYKIKQLGYSETFLRMWNYYLGYCEGGFLERSIGTVQMVMVKPGNRRAPV